jgi:hypothetical protein
MTQNPTIDLSGRKPEIGSALQSVLTSNSFWKLVKTLFDPTALVTDSTNI